MVSGSIECGGYAVQLPWTALNAAIVTALNDESSDPNIHLVDIHSQEPSSTQTCNTKTDSSAGINGVTANTTGTSRHFYAHASRLGFFKEGARQALATTWTGLLPFIRKHRSKQRWPSMWNLRSSRIRCPFSSFTASPTTLTSSGGSVNLSADVTNANTCTFSSTPAITGLPATVGCSNGTANETLTIPTDTTASAVTYTFELSATGTTTVSRGASNGHGAWG